MNENLLKTLLEHHGIVSEYTDAWGNTAQVGNASKKRLLEAMGYQTDGAALEMAYREELKAFWQQPLNPVTVVRSESSGLVEFELTLRLPIAEVGDTLTLTIHTEQGQKIVSRIVDEDLRLDRREMVDGVAYIAYRYAMASTLECGYHQLELASPSGPLASGRLIVAPHACYQPPRLHQGEKVWGLSVQLYCLRSSRNWGVGDFTDLAYLVEQVAALGAQFIGLNPIHTLYHANPEACSPYSPSSRTWLNFIYLDVTAMDGYASTGVQALINAPDFQRAIDGVRATDYVDYPGVMALKLRALEAVFDYQNQTFLKKNTRLNRQFRQFVQDGGESLEMLAVYEAIQEKLAEEGLPAWGWPVFPEELNEFHKPAVQTFARKHAPRIKFFKFLQWQAAIQLEATQEVARQKQMSIGLYRDLAVGVSEGSAEVWGNRELYCTDASIGAPPDVLGPLGQNWGLPPMDPRELQRQCYEPFIQLLRANMQSAGALRIDHVMALLRLWWIGKGDLAKDGGYVRYPVEDLLAILALESHRQKNLVIGEDLGTVPVAIREKLADHGVFSYRVFFFEEADDGGFLSPSQYPEQSMATLTTHDLPTLRGYWHCLDLEMGKDIGLYPSEEILAELYRSRHFSKQQILDSLHGHGSIPAELARDVDYLPMRQELNFGIQRHLAAGSSALLSLQLEDWLEMDQPVNIPGTFDEYPNWKRKLCRNLEDIFTSPEIQELARSISAARRKARQL